MTAHKDMPEQRASKGSDGAGNCRNSESDADRHNFWCDLWIPNPNKQILGEILHNSFANKVVESKIGISYTDDPDRAIEVIRNMLATVSEVTQEPSPLVGIESFADSAIEIGYRYWVPTQQYIQIRYAVNRAVYNGLMTAGINIPYPKLDITVENTQSSVN